VKEYIPPTNKFYFWRSSTTDHEILILRGAEPYIDWPGYTKAVLEVAEKTNVKKVLMIGAFIGNVPHTIEPVLSISTKSRSFLREISNFGFELSNYEGPTGIYTEILEACNEHKIDAASLWGPVPPYIQGDNPKLAFYMLEKIKAIAGIEISLQELKKKSEELDRQIANEARLNPELRRLIASLELEYRTLHRFPSYTV
jgi:proteasome assembly chaperone (PAC2) family protein